jgi:sterol desaturase/sphingolipid hydroxylase (fatty acid hydroxylase superfamily)
MNNFLSLISIETIIKFSIFVFVIVSVFTAETFFPFFKRINLKNKIVHDIFNLIYGISNILIATLLLIGITNVIKLFSINKEEFGLFNLINIPFWIKLIIGYLIIDIWMYTWHVINHKVKFLWLFHRMHHTDLNMDATSAIRFHPIEIIISTILRFSLLLLLGINPFIIIIYDMVLNTSTVFHHSNINLSEKIDDLLRIVIVTPNMHRVHHSQNQYETDSNYSTTLSIWDRIFKTHIKRVYPMQIMLGLKEFEGNKWQGFIGMLITPFINIKKTGN